ncbi:MAG: UDP-glucose 6-dehydrogenase [Candidatus Marinimicrobia bacterium]|nr:UDP-glucose 6-dehydrogenase [Candidatus Neomarinimicrobiota bacterium]
MKIAVIGAGYAGLVTGVCFSNVGNEVICLDVDADKISQLKSGEVPIYEPGLKEKLIRGLNSKNLKFTINSKKAIESSEIIFIAVGTPSSMDGGTDLSFVKSAVKTICKNLNSDKIVVTKSTVPVGTSHLVRDIIQSYIKKNNLDYKIDIINNPEFLKEGSAVNDFEKPDRIIIGFESKKVLSKIKSLYSPFNLHHDKIVSMDIRSSELTKYAANAMLATKISFINEMANICEKVDANINEVRKGIGTDPRIGFDFIYPGLGFGGSCFPKDLKSIQATSKKLDYKSKIIDAVLSVNYEQRNLFCKKIINFFKSKGHRYSDIKLGVWGLSFKPETDDVRNAPSIDVIRELLNKGFVIQAYDPVASKKFKAEVNHKNLCFVEDMYSAARDVNALILFTEWNIFRSPDFNKIKSIMKESNIFDGKNLFKTEALSRFGFNHIQVGVKN